MKRCTRCGDELTPANSRARSDRPGRFIAECTACLRAKSRARDALKTPTPTIERVSKRPCEVCYGLPWRADSFRCSGCGAERMPEPKPVFRDYLYTANYREIV